MPGLRAATVSRGDKEVTYAAHTPHLPYWILLSTTGAPSNFVVAVDIPTDRNLDYWVSMGAAMLCALAD